MRKKYSIIGLIAGLLSILLWLILNFFNPYSNLINGGTTFVSFVMLVLPGCLAIISFSISKKLFMLVAFIWSLPLSLYLLMTPGIFLIFGITSFTYLISYILMEKK
ncbi:hypothetical protein BGM26_06735 [Bacillus sp. FJAT-29790]|uniref:hypothetical protein n=1 Tax=Bacillus sp. FJAT-29790 TaxID=1895002 RepID=UPI001C228782|nr:hypothetical protein [Bacillus sp. FJAT-29790]MBU8878685.1 hypothetical protein [Bacillus sp. FJAT-29790]